MQLQGIRVHRTINPVVFNEVVNNPDIKKHLNLADKDAELDLSGLIFDLNNYALDVGFGGFMLIDKGNQVFEIHTILDRKKPKNYLAYVRQAMNYMFTSTPCMELISWADKSNVMTIRLMKSAGMNEVEADGDKVVYSLRYDDWVKKVGSEFEVLGDWFKENINDIDDPEYSRQVGIFVKTTYDGQIMKGLYCYNEWAKSKGYDEFSLISEDPVIINLGSCVVHLRQDYTYEVLPCL